MHEQFWKTKLAISIGYNAAFAHKRANLIFFKLCRPLCRKVFLSLDGRRAQKKTLPHTHPPHNCIDRRETCITYMYVGVGRGKLKRPHGVLSFLPLGMYVNSKHLSHTHTHTYTHSLSLSQRKPSRRERIISFFPARKSITLYNWRKSFYFIRISLLGNGWPIRRDRFLLAGLGLQEA